jgi:cytoskeletal protein CcmA (bactofilin family)
VAAENLTLRGAIDGDLLIGANRARLLEGAQITGNVWAAGAIIEIDATVDGDVRAVGGEIIIGGTVRGSAYLRADRVSLAPGAHIDGDLTYRARTPLTPDEVARVAGTVRANPLVDDGLEGGTPWSAIFWAWQTVAALLAGILVVALFRGFLLAVASVIPEKATVGTLLGFATFLIVPILSVVAMVTLVGFPIGLIAALLFLVTLYVAKLPVAVWAGGRLLALAGRPNASPYAAMSIGILLLYALFATPYLGWLFWLIATWLGFGALILSGLGYLHTREDPPGGTPDGER